MIYEIMLWNKTTGYAEWFQDSILPGLIGEHVFDAMTCGVCDELGLCANCDVHGCRCHVMETRGKYETNRKMCPVLFVDVVKPKWTMSDVV